MICQAVSKGATIQERAEFTQVIAANADGLLNAGDPAFDDSFTKVYAAPSLQVYFCTLSGSVRQSVIEN